MKKRWKNLLSTALACALTLTLLPAAMAAETGITDDIPDVFQGDGLYITVTPWSIQNNSEGWTLAKVGLNEAADENYFHSGFIPVFRNEKEVDEFGYYTGKTVSYINYADTEGNLLNLSGYENPPAFNFSFASVFSEGMAAFYDREAGLYGYMDAQGRMVIPPQFESAYAFSDGLAKVVAPLEDGESECYFIDKTGARVFSPFNGRWDTVGNYFNCGLIPYQGELGEDDYFVGYLDKEGQPVITIYRGQRSGYDMDHYLDLMLMTTEGYSEFSEDGYAILKDSRGGRTHPAYVIIDASGEQVGVLDAEPPAYVKLCHDSRSVNEGLLLINILNSDVMEEVVMDVHGNEVFRAPKGTNLTPFDSGVSKASTSYNEEDDPPLVLDASGNTVIPALGDFVKTERYYNELGELGGHYRVCNIDTFHDGVALMDVLRTGPYGGDVDGTHEYYLLEVHDGTYTGPGAVYDAATGTIRGGSATTEPLPDQPSGWAKAQVEEAVAAGIVPESLQSRYTQAATRAEFCALAVRLYEKVTGEAITQRATFSDTTDFNVQKMAGLGVVNGVGGGKFDPNGTLTREQAATILARLAEAMGHPLPQAAPAFSDSAAISSWAAAGVGQVQAAGIMAGDGSVFIPQSAYTREQCILTALRLYNLVNE